MNGKLYAIGLVALLAMIGTAVAPGALHANLWGGANGHEKNVANDAPDDHEDMDEQNETHEYVVPSVGGGGWFSVVSNNTTYKDTFGVFVSGNESVPSEFVFQGRDASVRVHSLNFTKIEFANNNTTATAAGWCTVNGVGGYWFNLTLTDGGNRSMDALKLSVYKDENGNGQMDETSPNWQWSVNGLQGGQIWSSSSEAREDMEDYDHDDDESEDHDSDDDFEDDYSPLM